MTNPSLAINRDAHDLLELLVDVLWLDTIVQIENMMFVTKKLCGRLVELAISAKRTSSDAVLRDFLDIPTPRSLPIIGTKLALWFAGSSKNLHEYADKRHRELGPIYREKLGPVTGVFVSDPNSIRSIFSKEGKYPLHVIPQAWTVYNKKNKYTRGLFFMDGDEWWEHRSIMNSLLLKGDLTWIEEATDVVIEKFIEDLKAKASSDIITLDQDLYRVFLEVLMSVLLGKDAYGKYRSKIQSLVNYWATAIQLVFEKTVELEMVDAEKAARLGDPRWKDFKITMANALFGANDILEKLTEDCGHSDGLLKRMRDRNVSADRINAIMADLVIAAADTTAYTMQWMLYSVSKYKHVQDKIREEILNPESNYTKHVLKETLRLYPVATFLTRILPEDTNISGYKIPKHTLMIMSIYSTGRDEKYFKNPLEFYPERWERANKDLVTQSGSLPFGIGSRSCIGRKLAEYELQSMLAKLVENFEMELCNKKEVRMVKKMVAAPSEPILLRLKKIT